MNARFPFIVASILLCASSALGQSVYVNYDRSLNFSQYHTYAWGQQPNPNEIKSPFLAKEAKRQIDMQLTSKGLQMVEESQNPDLVVIASGGMKVETSYNSWSTGWWGSGMTSVTPEQSMVGTLVVDLYASKAKDLAWRGVAQGTLNESNSEKNMKLVDKAVAKMFKKFPPQ